MTLILDVAVARAQREAERVVVTPDPTPGGGDGDGEGPGGGTPPISPPPGPGGGGGTGPGPTATRPTRYYASFEVPEDRPSGRIKEVLDEVVANLRRQAGATVRVTLEIEAEAATGFEDSTVRTVRENETTLKLEGNSFE